jgi:hypothetical protein
MYVSFWETMCEFTSESRPWNWLASFHNDLQYVALLAETETEHSK